MFIYFNEGERDDGHARALLNSGWGGKPQVQRAARSLMDSMTLDNQLKHSVLAE